MKPIQTMRNVCLAISLAVLAGCGNGQSDSATQQPEGDAAAVGEYAKLQYASPPTVHHDEAGRVKVELASAWAPDGRLVVRGVFTPDDQGYHLYGSDVPMKGVDGIGRPTRIDVADASSIGDVGPLVAAETAFDKVDPNLNVTLPVFPDGPVTLYLPIRLDELPDGPVELPLTVSYMACSDQRCNMPIQEAAVEFTATAPREQLPR